MKRIAKFHKVSKERFVADWMDAFEGVSADEAEKIYEGIRLPRRATAGSAGYDFFSPADFTIKPGETIKIPTGICVEMDQEWVLKCYPRSGLGFKFRLQLNNTVGIIDSDYFYSDNEGHIFAKLTNDTNENKVVELKADTGFMQGIFVEYGITVDDDVTDVRNFFKDHRRDYSKGVPAASASRAFCKTVSNAIAALLYSSSLSMLESMGAPSAVRVKEYR